MKTVFIALGVIFLILIVAVAGLAGYAAHEGTRLDASSKTYVDEAVPAIVTAWSREQLEERASPQLRKTVTGEQIDSLFSQVGSKLGGFKSYDGSKGDSNVSFTTQNGKVVTAAYKAEATFEKGKIDLDIKLIQVDGNWEILGFHISPHSEIR